MIYDYRCQSCSEIVTLVRKVAEVNDEVICKCGGGCEIVILASPVVKLDPISGDHPCATRKWEKMREQQMKREKKNMENHGTYN